MILATSAPITEYVGAAMLIATPILTAFGFIGKWLLNRLTLVEAEKNGLYDRLINDVVPALKSSTDQVGGIIQQQQTLATDREAMVKGLKEVITLQTQLAEKLEDLRRQELLAAKRRGGS